MKFREFLNIYAFIVMKIQMLEHNSEGFHLKQVEKTSKSIILRVKVGENHKKHLQGTK